MSQQPTQQEQDTPVGVRPRHNAESLATAAPDPERLALVNNIAGRLMLLSTDAVHGFAAIVERFELGQRRYGLLEIDSDRRNFGIEAIEELLDLCVYRGLDIVGGSRRAAIPPHTTVAITFDVSDVDEEPTQPRTRVITIPPALPEPTSTFDVVDGEVIEVLR